MTDHRDEASGEGFGSLEVALAHAAPDANPAPEVKQRLLATIRRLAGAPEPPRGFKFVFDADGEWRPYPVPGIRMKLLSVNTTNRYVTVLFDVEPGARFPAHHHSGAEECYVITGTLVSYGRTLGPGDFLHADGETDHEELYTETGCRVLLVVPPEDYLPGFADPIDRRAPERR